MDDGRLIASPSPQAPDGPGSSTDGPSSGWVAREDCLRSSHWIEDEGFQVDVGNTALAHRAEDIADEVRSVQRELGTVASVDWQGLAAMRFRERLAATGREVAAVADGCDRFADTLREHAIAVQELRP